METPKRYKGIMDLLPDRAKEVAEDMCKYDQSSYCLTRLFLQKEYIIEEREFKFSKVRYDLDPKQHYQLNEDGLWEFIYVDLNIDLLEKEELEYAKLIAKKHNLSYSSESSEDVDYIRANIKPDDNFIQAIDWHSITYRDLSEEQIEAVLYDLYGLKFVEVSS